MVKKLKQTSLVKATEHVSEAAQPYEMYGGAEADGTQTEGEPASAYTEDYSAGAETGEHGDGTDNGAEPEAYSAGPMTPEMFDNNAQTPEPQEPEDQDVTDMSNSENNLIRQKGLFFKAVDKHGAERGVGEKSLIALVDLVLEASGDGLIGGSDAAEIYARYRKKAAEKLGKFAAPDQGKGTLKAQVSKLRQIIEAGKVDGAKEVFEYARNLHVQYMNSQEKDTLREKGTYGALVNIAREQIKDKYQVRATDSKGRVPAALTEDEIHGVLVKENAEAGRPTTAFDVVIEALEKVELALDGRKATESRPAMEPLMDVNNPESRDEHLLEAREYLKQVIANHDPEYFSKIEAEANAKKAEAEEKAKRKAEADAEKAVRKAIVDAEKAAAKAAKAAEAAAKAAAAKPVPVAVKANVPHVAPAGPRKSPPVSVARSATGPAVAVVRSSVSV